jgi:phospholipase/lecithinase/hemolysin
VGTNYAIGGATTGLESFNSVNASVPDFLKPAYVEKSNAWQLSAYASQSPVFDPATSLFVVWLFPNDVFYADTTGTLPGVVPGSPGGANLLANGIANILTTVQTLALGGARHFLVPNMPDLGATPEFLNGPAAPFLSGLTAAFNANLAQQLSLLDAALPNADIVQFDTAALFRDLLADPAEFGFDVADQQCIQNLVNGKCDPSRWVFWDGLHPTTSTHQVLAQQFRAALVAEPHTLALMLLALGALGWSARRRSGALSPGAVAPG